ncbi:MAG: GTP-binding protein [Candidatus Lokiarchaeota archaeon]|nr:GTP-binding protein [Candidatus Lokiarchaeota archaeon]
MENHIDALLTNYMENVSGVLGAIITYRHNISIVISKKGNESSINLIHSFLVKTIDIIQRDYGKINFFLEIFLEDNKKYVICSFGETILTTIAESSTTDIELKVYSVHLADKIELIQKGEENISIDIPGIIRLFSKTKDGRIPKGNFSLKVVVTGDMKSGKSTMVNQFTHKKFDEFLTSTVGFEISKKTLEISEDIKINYIIWDIGGLKCRISPTKEMIYNFTDIALIVVDLTQKEYYNSIKRWYNEITESVLYEIPIICIGTKFDKLKDSISIEKKIKKITNEFDIPYFSVSAKNGYNIKEVFVEIADYIAELIYKKKDKKDNRINGKYERYRISSLEIEALDDLEELITINLDNLAYIISKDDLENFKKKGFPIVYDIDGTSFGIQILNGHVIGLGLFNCGLVNLPHSFKNLIFLKKLSLRCNLLSSLPKEITTLQSLEELDLALTGLMKLSSLIGNLKSLRILHLENNILNTLPEDFGDLKSLEVLYLDNNPLKAIPNRFCLLINLREFYSEAPHFFFRASLIELPKYFSNLKSLIILDLNSHELKKLPDSFGNLPSLKILILHSNKLKELPDSFGNIKEIEILDLEHNLLKVLPDSIGDLPKLRKINLTKNLLHKEGSEKFRALAFKTSGREYDRLMNLSDISKLEEIKQYRDNKKIGGKWNRKNALIMLGYSIGLALIGIITFFLFIDFSDQSSTQPIIWIIFLIALIVNILIGASIIPTISKYIKISIFIFQKKIYKIFDIFVIILLIWSIRSVVKTWSDVEIIPTVNFLFKFSIPEQLYDILVDIGYNLELSFLENIDLFFGHFFLKIFSIGLVFWALYRNGIGHIKKTAFDEKEKKNKTLFLILGTIGAFSLAIMDYSTLTDYLSISYSIGVCIGACTFIYVKHDNNLKLLIIYIFLIGTGITIIWIFSIWDMLTSLIIGIIYVIIFLVIRWRFLKKNF